MSSVTKDTIYIDVDDEITSIIDKVRRSPRKIVALVLPKRATTLQSIVNMKLLKREADEGKKSIVLITSEAALLPLAGATGLHVAKTLQSKPAIPVSPLAVSNLYEAEEVEVDPNKTIGELAGDQPADDETIDVDYSDGEEKAEDTKDSNKKPNKKLKVPNFERFRLFIILAAVAFIVLLIGGYWGFFIAPKAKITIKTDTSTINTALDFTASTSAKTLDKDKMIVPASQTISKKTDTQKVPATGQKDNGTKATGKMTIFYCPSNNNSQITLPAGSAFSNNGNIFRLTEDVTVPASNFTGGGVCKKDLSQTGNVSSDLAGDKYNLSSRSYSSVDHSDVSGTGSNMTGGTSVIVKVVSQGDVDAAKQLILDRTKSAAISELKKQLTDQGMFVLSDSLVVGAVTTTANPPVGAEANETTVTATATYTMTAISQSNLQKLIENDVKHKIDVSKQTILDNDYGLGKAVVKLGDKTPNGDTKVSLQVSVTAGPQLDGDSIKKEVAGKKKGETVSIIKNRPGIKDVTVDYKPFWVLSTPKKTAKITVVFEKADGTH